MNVQWGQWRLLDAVSECKFHVLQVQSFVADEEALGELTEEQRTDAYRSIDQLWGRLLNSDLV